MNELLKITKQLERLWKAYYLLQEVFNSVQVYDDRRDEPISGLLVHKIYKFFTEE